MARDIAEIKEQLTEHRKLTLKLVLFVVGASGGGAGVAHVLLSSLGG